MAETRTARMRLVHWSEGTDSPQRVDFNETFLSIENLAAIDQQGVEQDRPLPNKRGMYYFATDKGILYRSDGLAWAVVGSSTLSQLVRSARSDAVAMTIQAIAGQTADLLRMTSTSGATYVRVRPNGDVLAGPVRISQAARTTTAADTAPTDSAVTIDSASASMWNHTAKNTTGNTAGFYRAVRGTSTVFSIGPDGTVTTPAVTLTSAPSSDSHAVRRTDLTSAIASNVYDINGSNISGVLGVAKGGTGGTTQATARSGIGAAASATTFTAGTGLSGGGTLGANRTFSVDYAGNGTANSAARSDHAHDINSSSITGTLSVAGGGTGRTSITSGQYVIGAGTSGVTSKTPAQVLADIGAATSGHGHALTDANITGTLPVAQGGTGATTAAAARTALAVPVNTTSISTGNGLTGGGNLTASRTISVQFAGSGSANTVARSDHTHNASDIVSRLTVEQMPNTIELAGEVDLDTILADGNYSQTSSAEVASGANYPSGIAGHLRVVSSGSNTMIWQYYTTYTTTNPTNYLRTRYNSTWGAWRQVADQADLTALVDVYAAKSHKHSLSSSDITGTLPLNQGGTGATTAAAARTALAVPSTSISVKAGAGLSGGGTLAANRTLQVVFEGSGTKDSAARSDHEHTSLESAGGRLYFHATTGALYHFVGSTRVFTAGSDGSFSLDTAGVSVSSSGTISGAKMSWSDITSKPSTFTPSTHGHALTDSNITGTLPVNQGGTGATTASAARSNIEAAYVSRQIIAGTGLAGGGTLAANRTLNVNFPSTTFTLDGSTTGSSDIAARYDHKHNLTGTYIEGNLPWEKNSLPITLSTEDLDTLTSTAVYHQNQDINATAARNYPPGERAGLLEVVSSGDMVYQYYTDYSSSGAMWRRSKYRSNAWYGWKRMAEVGTDIDPLATRVGELEPVIATLALPSTSKWAGHGYRPQIIREGKRRTLRGRVSPTGADFAQKGGAGYLFNLPAIDRSSSVIGGIGQVAGFSSLGFARVEIGNASVPAGDVLAVASKTTDWIGVDGISWYVD